uniref:Phage portal protein n=1 Tax=Syphacia muris TaxID=451379 RepID=A0A0N5B1E8_9BILA
MIACNGCGSAFMPKANGLSDDDLIQLYVNNLPTLPYVVDQLLNFIFSNGLTTGDENLDETVLKPFLFAHNVKGVTNYSVLREGIREAMIWGKCGLRWLSEEDGLICMPHTQYTSVIARDGEYLGFDKTVFYIASTDPSLPVQVGPEPIKFDEQEFIQNHHLVSDDGRIFVIRPDEFTNLRNDTTIENGTSRLMKDRQRLYLLEQIYERLNYDIKYDGPGRLIFWTKDGFMSGEVEMGAGEILNQSPEAIDSRKEKAKREVKELLEQIKGSSSDNIIAVSSMFEKM